MSDNKKHFFGQNPQLDQKILTDRSQLKFLYGFKLGESGNGRAFYVEAITGSGMSLLSKLEFMEASKNADIIIDPKG